MLTHSQLFYVGGSITCFILLYYYFTQEWKPDLVLVKANTDNHYYEVRNMDDKKQAADMLATVRNKLKLLVTKLVQHYPNDKRVKLLQKRFKGDVLSELSSYADPKYTSYSVAKGEKIVFCLRSRDAQQRLVSMQTLMFVAIHELAHVMSISIGHTEEFWNNMRFLLANAIVWKLYKPINYAEKPEPYCGLQITSSPLGPECSQLRKYVTYDKADEIQLKFDETNDACVVAS